MKTQLRLEAFYTFNERFAKIRSKRIKKAVKDITGKQSIELTDDAKEDVSRSRKKRKVGHRDVSGEGMEEVVAGNQSSCMKKSNSTCKRSRISSDHNDTQHPEQDVPLKSKSKTKRRNTKENAGARGRGVGRGRRRQTETSSSDDNSINDDDDETCVEKLEEPQELRRVIFHLYVVLDVCCHCRSKYFALLDSCLIIMIDH